MLVCGGLCSTDDREWWLLSTLVVADQYKTFYIFHVGQGSKTQSCYVNVADHRLFYIYSTKCSRTLTPSPGLFVNVKPCFSSPRFDPSILSILCMSRTKTYPIVVSANCWPMQMRGPPLKGRYSHCGRRFLHLSGLYSRASSPQRSFLLCITYGCHD